MIAKYKASYQIGAKSTTSEARKKKEQRKKGEKAEARNLLKQKKKSMPYFLFPGRSPPCRGLWAGHIWFSPTGNSWLWNPTFVYRKDRQGGMLARSLLGKLLRQGSPACPSLSATSSLEGEWTYNCLIGQYLSTNGLFGTSYVFSWIWPCNGHLNYRNFMPQINSFARKNWQHV